jgi:1,2-diacylglycerol 3-beta-glucosyltransferase
MPNSEQTILGKINASLHVLIFLMQSGLALLVGYLLVLTGASRRASARTKPQADAALTRFLVIIPAHNEEKLIGSTLESLAKLDYPVAAYSVHVIADNCTDKTAETARAHGALVYERYNNALVGKGYALQWLLEQIWQKQIPHDAVLFLDADSLVSPNFLQVMSARIQRGEKIIQAYYAVREPEGSWNSSLRYAALAVLHYLRPQGRMVMGGSAGLKGNGMAFEAETIRRYPWSGSLTEDIEQHMALLLDGERVTFAPDAVVLGEMPDTFDKMHSQHMRWERGRLETARIFVPILFKSSLHEVKSGSRQRAFLLFDAAMEHIIPPFSVLAGLSGISLFASILLGLAAPKQKPSAARFAANKRSQKTSPLGTINLLLGFGLVLAQLTYLLTGLRQVKAPRHIYRNLLYAPLLILWKLKQYVQALLVRGPLGWKRTARNEE